MMHFDHSELKHFVQNTIEHTCVYTNTTNHNNYAIQVKIKHFRRKKSCILFSHSSKTTRNLSP